MVPGRTAGVPEWLDLIKQEFESLSHEAMVVKAQRDECEHKSTCTKNGLDMFLLGSYFIWSYSCPTDFERHDGCNCGDEVSAASATDEPEGLG